MNFISLELTYILTPGNSCIVQFQLSVSLALVNHNLLMFYVVYIPLFAVWQPSAHTFKFPWVCQLINFKQPLFN